MTDPSTILSYRASANLADAGDLPPDAVRVAIPQPPAIVEAFVLFVAAVSCVIFTAILGVLCFAGFADRTWGAGEIFRELLGAIVMFGLIVLALRMIVRALRWLRFGRLPSVLAVSNGHLHLQAPTRRGLQIRSWPADEVERIRIVTAGRSLTLRRIVEVRIEFNTTDEDEKFTGMIRDCKTDLRIDELFAVLKGGSNKAQSVATTA